MGESIQIKPGKKRDGGAPVIELPQADVKVLEAEFFASEKEIETSSGTSFTAAPHLNAKLEVADDFLDGSDDGKQWYENFNLQRDDQGGYEVRPNGKLGALIAARYGQEWFRQESAGIDPDDFVGFTFRTKLQQKADLKGNLLQGTVCNRETIMAIPQPKKKDASGLRQVQRRATEAANEGHAEGEEVPDSEPPEDEDWENLPF